MRTRLMVALLAAVLGGCQDGERAAPKPTPEPAALAPAAPAPIAPAPSAPAPSAPAPSAPAATAPAPSASDPYARDVDRICRVEELAQVDGTPGVNPQLVTAQWLAANLETTAARDLMIKMNQAPESERAGVLDAEAARVGLTTGCPTARRWD